MSNINHFHKSRNRSEMQPFKTLLVIFMNGFAVMGSQTCGDIFSCASYKCDDTQLTKTSFICGIEPCTSEQCCVDKQQYCEDRLQLEHKCSDYSSICIRESFVQKSNFNEIVCGEGITGICTTDICCHPYGAFLKHVHFRALEMLSRA